MSIAEAEFTASTNITEPLQKAVIEQSMELPYEITESQRKKIREQKRDECKLDADRLKQGLPAPMQRSMDLAQENGASAWLTTLPIREFGFNLHKGAFLDALALRYNWKPARAPSDCACGKKFSVDHALSCPKGGFPSIRHNEIRDVTANLLSDICTDVCIEPHLQPMNGEKITGNIEDGARLDIAANGFWGGCFDRTYIDVRLFKPHAPSNRHSNCYRKHEMEKKRQYEQRVQEVEHASFTPLVLSASGGMANQATIFCKRLASSLAQKWEQPYSSTLYWLHTESLFHFSALQSNVSVAHAPDVDMLPGLTLQWTWPCLNYTFEALQTEHFSHDLIY